MQGIERGPASISFLVRYSKYFSFYLADPIVQMSDGLLFVGLYLGFGLGLGGGSGAGFLAFASHLFYTMHGAFAHFFEAFASAFDHFFGAFDDAGSTFLSTSAEGFDAFDGALTHFLHVVFYSLAKTRLGGSGLVGSSGAGGSLGSGGIDAGIVSHGLRSKTDCSNESDSYTDVFHSSPNVEKTAKINLQAQL